MNTIVKALMSAYLAKGGCLVFCLVHGFLCPSEAQVLGKEYLYMERSGFAYKIDPQSGNSVDRWYIGGPGVIVAENITSWRGRTWGLGRLNDVLEHSLYSRNPADAEMTSIVSLGVFVPSRAVLEIHPHTGKFYACLNHSLYELDPQTGRQIFIGSITGTTYGGAWAIGMDAQGVLYTCDASSPPSLTKFYSIDLQSGHASVVGAVLLPTGVLTDLAFDSNGELWGALGFVDENGGLFKIDIQAGTAVRMFPDLWYTWWQGGPPDRIAFLRDSAIREHCAPKQSFIGCTPTIGGIGIANPGARHGFLVWAERVPNQAPGVLLFGTAGPTGTPFLGGTLCVGGPLQYGPVVHSGGSSPHHADCTGRFELDFNTYMLQQNLSLTPGLHVQAQWLGRDPLAAPPANVCLSDALDIELLP